MDKKNLPLPHTHEWAYDNGPHSLHLIVGTDEAGQVVSYTMQNGHAKAKAEWKKCMLDEGVRSVWLDLSVPDCPEVLEIHDNTWDMEDETDHTLSRV